MPGQLIRLANQRISMATACRWAGMSVSDGEGSRKIRCPFGDISHSDGGVAASFRVYEETNSAFCFSCQRGWAPVGLMAEFWDCARAEAAERMCQMAGITPPGWRERWAELQQPLPPDRDDLAEALKQWCLRVCGPSWRVRQFDREVVAPLAACLGVLPLVTTDQEADEWLDRCQLVMLPLLAKEEVSCDERGSNAP